jgi:RHS repeat-associated protein
VPSIGRDADDRSPLSTVTLPIGFTGGYSTGGALIYLIARYYDPSTAQFLTVDPKVATTLSPYGYVQGDPINSTDPSGGGDTGCANPNNAKACIAEAQRIASEPGICLRNPFGGNNGNGGCESYLSTSQGVTAIGISLSIGSVIATGGAALPAELDISAFGLSGGSLALGGSILGIGGAGVDIPQCISGNQAACAGAWLGGAGAILGLPAIAAGYLGVGAASTLAGVLGGVSIGGAEVGIAGTLIDLIRAFAGNGAATAAHVGSPQC